MTDSSRLTIDLSPEVHDELQALTADRGITLTELFKRAIALDQYCWVNRIAPIGATLVPGHWLCRLRRHRSLRWTEDTDQVSTTGTRTRITAARCKDCDRDQTRVRVVYPSANVIKVRQP